MCTLTRCDHIGHIERILNIPHPSDLLTSRRRAGGNLSNQKIKNFLDTHGYSWILINFVFEIWQQHHIIWVVDTICFLLLFHKILLAPLLRYSLLVTYCVKIYEIITREPYCDGAARGSPGCPALVFPDHREHQVQTQWAGGAWYYYGIIMTLTHYKVNTSSVQQGSQAV